MTLHKHCRFFIIPILFLFSSCGMIIRSYIKNHDEVVPPDFGKEKEVLLVITHRNSYNKKLVKQLKKKYSGDYLLITEKELIEKYDSPEKYRYVFDKHTDVYKVPITAHDYSSVSKKDNFRQNRSQTTSTASISFYVLDRKTKTEYESGISSGFAQKILKAYIKKLDERRKKNEGN